MDPDIALLSVLIGFVACVYSMVGHGGASGYLAVLSLIGLTSKQVSTTALCLNLAVAGIAFFSFRQAGHFKWSLTWPFIVGSIPMSFLGSTVKLTEKTYFMLLGIVLVYAGLRLMLAPKTTADQTSDRIANTPLCIGVGAGIGVLSGMVGVGGGIFLSPILVLTKWADARAASATSAVFILVNSASGLLGRAKDGFTLPANFEWFLIAGVIGALAGSSIGARVLTGTLLRRALGAVLLFAAVKLLLK